MFTMQTKNGLVISMASVIFRKLRKNKISAIIISVLVTLFLLSRRQTVPVTLSHSGEMSRTQRLAAEHPSFQYSSSKLPDESLKTILLWNTWFDWSDIFFFGLGQQPFIDAKCPVSNCFISNDKSLMPPSEFDAVLFFFPMMTEMPFTYSRKPNQFYVYVNEESPKLETRVNSTHLNNYFNLTVTYRSDSDIHWPYGRIQLKPGITEPTLEDIEKLKLATRTGGTNYAAGKKLKVAWFVSNCKSTSYRERYVESLKKYIDVDVYGACGDKVCWAGDQDSCYEMLENDYKFYLSFENSLCREYVTEKFFQMMSRRIIPIVYGAANYSAIAPKHSYIDATQIGAKKLAELLLQIDSDDDLYNEYFWWKPYYTVMNKREDFAKETFCKLCEILNRGDRQHQVYEDFESWWKDQNHCHESNIFRIPMKEFSFTKIKLESMKKFINRFSIDTDKADL